MLTASMSLLSPMSAATVIDRADYSIPRYRITLNLSKSWGYDLLRGA
jgi:hypothetical protein